MKKKHKKQGTDVDKAIASAGTVQLQESSHTGPHTDIPLAEKDEVKQAEERLRKKQK